MRHSIDYRELQNLIWPELKIALGALADKVRTADPDVGVQIGNVSTPNSPFAGYLSFTAAPSPISDEDIIVDVGCLHSIRKLGYIECRSDITDNYKHKIVAYGPTYFFEAKLAPSQVENEIVEWVKATIAFLESNAALIVAAIETIKSEMRAEW